MRLSAAAYAAQTGVHVETIKRWCRNSMLPTAERNSKLPPMVCRRVGKSWQIAAEKTEMAMSLICGNPAVKGGRKVRQVPVEK